MTSRALNPNTKFEISQELFNEICMELDFFPEVDMFASRLNNNCEKCFSYCLDPFCMGVDAFLTSWSHHKLYIFPPFNCCSRVVCKLLTDRTTALVVLPDWPGQPWYPQLLKMVKKNAKTRTVSITSHGPPMPILPPWNTGAPLANFQSQKLLFYYFRIAATEHMGWQHCSVNHMLRHFAHSTHTTYSTGVNWWVDFCDEYNLDIFNPTFDSLEIFFIMLFGTTKIFGTTIQTYRIAISYLFLNETQKRLYTPTSIYCWKVFVNKDLPSPDYLQLSGT